MNLKQNGKIVIGLTGAVGSGKSAALKMFEALGAQTISADALAAEFFEQNKSQIAAKFNTRDKAQIAGEVFKNPAAKQWLQEMLHPLILERARQIIDKTDKKIIVFEAPLLVEAGLINAFDFTLCIYADYNLRERRANFTGADFKRRDAAQTPLAAKAQLCDAVVYNNGAKEDLEAKITKLWALF
ncbi:MAG: dephospho-CoA kinase [Elusimicrobiota bacterium]|jgi:dephospho-CoA kinase|nr:dephospho-CoA kinase [Elusimicrobiota bacterium]